MYYAIDAMLVVVTLFFLFLPITDPRTVKMKLGMMAVAASLFTASIVHTATATSSGQASQAIAMNSR